MPLKQDLLSLNRFYAGDYNAQLPYTLDDVRTILLSSVKFDKSYTFKGLLPPDTVNKLRSDQIDVQINENGHTVLSWGLR